MLGTLDFTGSEHWAPFNFPFRKVLHGNFSIYVCVNCVQYGRFTKYTTCTNTRHAIHHLSLKMFENIRNISKSTANHSTLQFQSCNKEHHKILKEAQIIKLQSTKWNWINTNFCSWLSETNDHSRYFSPKYDGRSKYGLRVSDLCSLFTNFSQRKKLSNTHSLDVKF